MFLAALLFLLDRVLKILAHWSRQKFGGMNRLRAPTPNSESVREQGVFAHRGRHGDQDGQAEQGRRGRRMTCHGG